MAHAPCIYHYLIIWFLDGNRGYFGGYIEATNGGGGLRRHTCLVGSGSPDGTTEYASATRIAVKPCTFGAPLRGCGA
jgi:hypothetical protein